MVMGNEAFEKREEINKAGGHYLCAYRLGRNCFVYHMVDSRANNTRLLADLPVRDDRDSLDLFMALRQAD